MTCLPSLSRWLLGALLLAVFVGGCVSAQERFERAQSYENEGRYADAAYAYVKVLEDESGFPDARRNLFDVAQQAVSGWMDAARRADDAEQYERSVGHLNEVRDLRAACQRVGVDLPLPNGYTAFRDGVEERAADQLIAEADAAAQAGDFPAAHRAYEQARQYVDASDRLARIDESQAEVLLGWADQEMQREHFQAAYKRAERVYSLVPESHSFVEEADALQQTAVERGTRRVAFLPVWRTESAARALSPVFVGDVNDVLYTRYWSAPPPFIAPADPVALRRTMRRYGADASILSRRDAAQVGRGVEADFVVAAEITEFARLEDDIETERVAAGYVPEGRGATRGRRSDASGPVTDTSYVRRTYDLALEAVVEYRVIDVRSGRVLASGVEPGGAEGPMEEGSFDGDWRNLDLSGAEKDLFDPEVLRRREREIENRLVDGLTQDLSTEIFDDILREIE